MENAAIIQERAPVWMALSNLYLDTELQEDDYAHLADVFNKSPYSLEEIALINRYEVAPVLLPNLLSIAGEWAAFDKAWLIEKISWKVKDYNRIYHKEPVFPRFIRKFFRTNDWKRIGEKYYALQK
jgi:hypothetical protein